MVSLAVDPNADTSTSSPVVYVNAATVATVELIDDGGVVVSGDPLTAAPLPGPFHRLPAVEVSPGRYRVRRDLLDRVATLRVPFAVVLVDAMPVEA